MFHAIWSWFLTVTGVHNVPSAWNLWWGGFGSAGVISTGLFANLFHQVRSRNCASKGCWRIGTHEYEKDGVTHRLCHRCHPALQGKRHTREEFLIHHRQKEAA